METTMKVATLLAASLATATLAPAVASAQNVVLQMGTTDQGPALVTGDGFSLYTFDKDAPAVSNCNDACAEKWPPLTATRRARPTGDFGIIIRADGSRQWAYKGQPLYTWINDSQAGQTTGDGVKGVWHLAR
jgi:predicted lipoprotein with Yx(FWY)xxD motif